MLEGIRPNSATVPVTSTAYPLASPAALKRLSNYRLAAGWLILAFWFPSLLALDWDAQWHVQVGRDGFWTPPHWMFYSTVAVAGAVCLVIVLLETFLYYRRFPGFNQRTTTSVLFVFRGPVGFILAGFGMLIMVSSAPLDDYWHRIIGVDLQIWTPFHAMLLLGILIANLGIIYLFASEMNRRRTWALVNPVLNYLGDLFNPATLGLTLAIVAFLSRYWFLMAETVVGNLRLGDFKLPSYSLTLAAVPLLLVLMVNVTGRVGAATFMAILFELYRWASIAFVDWGVKVLATDQGVTARPGTFDLQYISSVYPVYLILAGLLVDGIYLVTTRFRKSAKAFPALTTAVGASLAAGLLLFLLEKPWENYNAAIARFAADNPIYAIYAAANQFLPAYWQSLPLVLVIAALAGAGGLAVATSLRYTDR